MSLLCEVGSAMRCSYLWVIVLCRWVLRELWVFIIAFSSNWCCQPPLCCIDLSILLAASFCILWRNLLVEPCALSLGSVVTWCRFYPILFCLWAPLETCLSVLPQAVTWQYLAGVGRPMRGIWISLRWHKGWRRVKGEKMQAIRLHYTVGFDLLCCVLSGPFFSVSNKWVVVSVLPPGWWLLLHMATLHFVIVRWASVIAWCSDAQDPSRREEDSSSVER